MAYPSFLARPVAPVRGIATRGPAAAARATGGVPVITTDQGVNVPAPQGPAGLPSLTRNMQQEIEDTESPDELNWKMAQAGEELGRLFRGEQPGGGQPGGGQPGMFGGTSFSEADILAEEDPRTALVQAADAGVVIPASSSDEISHDDRVYEVGGAWRDPTQAQANVPYMDSLVADAPTEETDPLLAEYEKSLAKTMGAPALTTEAANKQAKKILGIKEKEDVPDWAMPLFTFGMALMAEPGSFGQAVGKAGLKTVPVIAQVKKEKKAERFRVAQIARDLMKTDVATRKGALSNAMSLIFKKAGERRLTAAEKRANSAELRAIRTAELEVEREKRLATSAKATRELQKREKALQERRADLAEKQYGLKVQNAVTSTFKMYIDAMPQEFKLPMARALGETLQDTKSFGNISKNITPAQTTELANNTFKTVLDNLVKIHPRAALAAQGYEIPQNEDYGIRTVTVDEPVMGEDGKPVLGADGQPVTRQMERLVRMNINEVWGVERGPDGEVLIDPDTKQPIAKKFAPGTKRIVLDKGTGKVLAQGNGDAGWTSGSKVERVGGQLIEFKGRINGRPFVDVDGIFWKQGANFTKIPGDLGNPLQKDKPYSFMVQDPNTKAVSIYTGFAKNAPNAIAAFKSDAAAEKLNENTLAVADLSRDWGQLRDLVNINPRAMVASNELVFFQQGLLRGSDFVYALTDQRPNFEKVVDDLGFFQNFGTNPGQQQANLGGTEIKGPKGLKSYMNKLGQKGYVKSIANTSFDAAYDNSNRTLNEEELSALQGLAEMRTSARSLIFSLAYALARTNEPGGRLTDRDIANALLMMGVSENGRFRPRELTLAMDRQVANSQSSVLNQWISRTMPSVDEMRKTGKMDPGVNITKKDIFDRFKVPIFQAPTADRFGAPSDETGGADSQISVGEILAKRYPEQAKQLFLNGKWDPRKVSSRLRAAESLVKQYPGNELYAKKAAEWSEIFGALKPSQR